MYWVIPLVFWLIQQNMLLNASKCCTGVHNLCGQIQSAIRCLKNECQWECHEVNDALESIENENGTNSAYDFYSNNSRRHLYGSLRKYGRGAHYIEADEHYYDFDYGLDAYDAYDDITPLWALLNTKFTRDKLVKFGMAAIPELPEFDSIEKFILKSAQSHYLLLEGGTLASAAGVAADTLPKELKYAMKWAANFISVQLGVPLDEEYIKTMLHDIIVRGFNTFHRRVDRKTVDRAKEETTSVTTTGVLAHIWRSLAFTDNEHIAAIVANPGSDAPEKSLADYQSTFRYYAVFGAKYADYVESIQKTVTKTGAEATELGEEAKELKVWIAQKERGATLSKDQEKKIKADRKKKLKEKKKSEASKKKASKATRKSAQKKASASAKKKALESADTAPLVGKRKASRPAAVRAFLKAAVARQLFGTAEHMLNCYITGAVIDIREQSNWAFHEFLTGTHYHRLLDRLRAAETDKAENVLKSVLPLLLDAVLGHNVFVRRLESSWNDFKKKMITDNMLSAGDFKPYFYYPPKR